MTNDEINAMIATLNRVSVSSALIEAARLEVEKTLIEYRDARISEFMRGNGLVIREKDGKPSDVIRFGPETAIRIGLKAMCVHLATLKALGEDV